MNSGVELPGFHSIRYQSLVHIAVPVSNCHGQGRIAWHLSLCPSSKRRKNACSLYGRTVYPDKTVVSLPSLLGLTGWQGLQQGARLQEIGMYLVVYARRKKYLDESESKR